MLSVKIIIIDILFVAVIWPSRFCDIEYNCNHIYFFKKKWQNASQQIDDVEYREQKDETMQRHNLKAFHVKSNLSYNELVVKWVNK